LVRPKFSCYSCLPCQSSHSLHLATSTTVAMVESLRPVPAFGVIILVQGVHKQKDPSFWIGSAVILMSTIIFEIPHRWHLRMRKTTNQTLIENQPEEPLSRHVRISLPNSKTALRELQYSRDSTLSSTNQEHIRLLDVVEDQNSVS
jgi:hypothetical protein